ncbi:peptidoglycan D,D-transpeptidase FtsI family protein [Arenicella xantha]|uniref:Peptidoglycan D,D-transpeptidase FtsI n=1 Tax=Arenicella xantha TaxID=644221 RepID=A0A395JI97_9GAMM|nr:penicillin-binding transpeptidase domain-containing protein [Arenicella xantha]RBP49860.1 peptidoglycan synthetase FtsI [Arenicella xantha]
MARGKPIVTATKRKTQKEVVVPVASWRYKMIGGIFGLIFIGLIVRAVHLQIIDNDYLQSQGDARYLRVQKEEPTRGMIVDRNHQPLAISTPVDSIWMHPATILRQQNEYSYEQLTGLLGMTRAELLAKAEKAKAKEFSYLKRQLSPHLANKILSLDVPGINSVREYKRYYPAGPVLGHVLGFTNIDNEGQEGLELAFNKSLKGLPGRTQVLRDRFGHVVEYVEQLSQVEHGQDITLSLDARIQYLAYRHLQAAVKKHQASSASLVALDAKTGEVLAMVSMPDFNPNDRSDLISAQFRNRSIADSFEPGSTVKPITIAMALEEGVITPDTIIDAEKGFFYIGRSRISDTKSLGEITVTDVIKRSSNIGAAKIAMMMSARDLYDTYRLVGFGSTNDLKMPGEQRGILAKRKKWRPIEHATLSYGYGLSVNTLQLARAYQALANDGVLLPISIHPVTDVPEGKRVFSKTVTDQVALMLEAAVSDEGTAPRAQVDQYRVGGKTGTAHKVLDGRYQDDAYMSIFAGFAPISDPEIVLVVSVDDPKGVDYYGGLVAAPVFSEVMAGALRFRNVAPDALESDAKPELKLMIARPRATEAG